MSSAITVPADPSPYEFEPARTALVCIDFQRDFVALLRTAHGEKWISSNKFYNEYIRDKEHVHVSDLARKHERDGADSSR